MCGLRFCYGNAAAHRHVKELIFWYRFCSRPSWMSQLCTRAPPWFFAQSGADMCLDISWLITSYIHSIFYGLWFMSYKSRISSLLPFVFFLCLLVFPLLSSFHQWLCLSRDRSTSVTVFLLFFPFREPHTHSYNEVNNFANLYSQIHMGVRYSTCFPERRLAVRKRPIRPIRLYAPIRAYTSLYS